MTRSRDSAVVAMLGALAGGHALAAEIEPGPVEDLAYGEVLFHFYQEDYFTALTRLLAAQAREELPSHAGEAELLLGGLYLSYGQHRLAGRIFEELLAGAVDPSLHDRAWFFLAKIWHQRGYLDEALAALGRIQADLPEELEPERRMLHAQVLMDKGEFDAALALLAAWPGRDTRWVAYAKFNVGVALVRLGQVEAGARVLDDVGQIEAADSDAVALRDKANVALGYAWLQAQSPAAAKPPLQRVRLDGPFSTKALLGVGWADAEQQNYRGALAPWVELQRRDLLDPAVQESLLAVPYAYAQLGADGQAAEHYTNAIAAFTNEIAQLDAAIEAIGNGELLTNLLEHGREYSSGWYWRLDRVPDSIESRYLYELMSTHRFQEGLKNYRDLRQLDRTLAESARSLGAFDDILDTRQRAYAQRLPAMNAALANIDVAAMNARRVELESRLSAIERSEDYVALATPEEQALWGDLVAAEPGLARLGDGAQADELRGKHRFLKGLMIWDLRKKYHERLWLQRRALRDLDRELRAADRLELRVRNGRDGWPEQFADQTVRVAALSQRVYGLQGTVTAALTQQQDFLQAIAIEELEAQRGRLGTYMVQAQFSLAAIYDRAAANFPAPAGGVAAEAQ